MRKSDRRCGRFHVIDAFGSADGEDRFFDRADGDRDVLSAERATARPDGETDSSPGQKEAVERF